MIRNHVVIALMLTLPGLCPGQEMNGITSGVYSGSGSAYINPSGIATSPIKLEIHLATFHGYEDNNYFYLPAGETSLIKIFTGDYGFPYYPKPFGVGERNILAYYDDPSEKSITGLTRIYGPSAMFRIGRHRFSMHAGYRIASSTRRLPYDIANFSYYGLDFYPQHNIEYDRSNYDMASLAWWDLGVTYATYFGDGDYTTWSAGITANYLLGYAATYVTGDQTNYIAYNDSILNVINLDGELGLSLPVNYETDVTDYTEDLVRGHGFGFDLGVSWQYNESNGLGHRKGLNPANVQSVYKVKLGLSLLDLGSIRFSKNAEKHIYDQVGNPSINVNELEYDNIRDELNETSRLLYGDPSASLKDDHFSVWLPAALSLQGDYHYRGPWYISGTVVLPMVFASPMVQRTAQFAVAPRYETRNFAINLPLLLNDFRYARWGLSLRIYGLTLGTDRLGAFLGLNDLTGMDAYASLKVNIYDRDSRHRNRRNPCDSF